jgi:hypothetical protein
MYAFVSVDPAVQVPDHLAVVDLAAKKLVRTVYFPTAAAASCYAVVDTA